MRYILETRLSKDLMRYHVKSAIRFLHDEKYLEEILVVARLVEEPEIVGYVQQRLDRIARDKFMNEGKSLYF